MCVCIHIFVCVYVCVYQLEYSKTFSNILSKGPLNYECKDNRGVIYYNNSNNTNHICYHSLSLTHIHIHTHTHTQVCLQISDVFLSEFCRACTVNSLLVHVCVCVCVSVCGCVYDAEFVIYVPYLKYNPQ